MCLGAIRNDVLILMGWSSARYQRDELLAIMIGSKFWDPQFGFHYIYLLGAFGCNLMQATNKEKLQRFLARFCFAGKEALQDKRHCFSLTEPCHCPLVLKAFRIELYNYHYRDTVPY